MNDQTRAYRFVITFEVEPDHPADRFKLREVALLRARFGAVQRWKLSGLLDQLVGRPVNLPQVRDDFAAVLDPAYGPGRGKPCPFRPRRGSTGQPTHQMTRRATIRQPPTQCNAER